MLAERDATSSETRILVYLQVDGQPVDPKCLVGRRIRGLRCWPSARGEDWTELGWDKAACAPGTSTQTGVSLAVQPRTPRARSRCFSLRSIIWTQQAKSLRWTWL